MQSILTSLAMFLLSSVIPANQTMVVSQKTINTSPSIPTPTIISSPMPTSIQSLTPTPVNIFIEPVRQAVHPAMEEIETSFLFHATTYNVPVEQLKSIAYCESKYNPAAVNGIYGGIFQFSPSTWATTRSQMNLDPNPELRFIADEAIKTAAFKISIGGINAWRSCL